MVFRLCSKIFENTLFPKSFLRINNDYRLELCHLNQTLNDKYIDIWKCVKLSHAELIQAFFQACITVPLNPSLQLYHAELATENLK